MSNIVKHVEHCQRLLNIVKHWIVMQPAVCWIVAWYVCKSWGTSTKEYLLSLQEYQQKHQRRGETCVSGKVTTMW